MNLDDPKLTAYALGEMTEAAELSEVESWLAQNPAGRAFVTDTQEMAAFLSEKLRVGAPVALTAEQRDALLAEKKIIPLPVRRTWSIIGLTALAACLAAGPLLPWTEILRLRNSSTPTLAINDRRQVAEGKNSLPALEAESFSSTSFDLALTGKKARPILRRESSIDRDFARDRSEFAKAQASAASTLVSSAQDAPNGGQDAHPTRENVASAVDSLRKPTFNVSSVKELPALETKLADSRMEASQPRSVDVSQMAVTGAMSQMQITAAPASPRAQADVTGFSGGVGKAKRGAASSNATPGRDFADEQNGVFARAVADKDGEQSNTEAYDFIAENGFLAAKGNPLSTFSIDVDTASYANVRRFLNDGQLPPKGAVRIEEMLNYFTYDYTPPTGDAPFSTNLEVAACPWQPEHRLVRIGLKGREIPVEERKPSNLVFLIDVSGSMDEPNKLPLLKQSLQLLVDQLGENDRVALAVYAGNSGLVLPSTSNKAAIRSALENLKAGGSTNGASGIQLAYEQAAVNFQKEGTNRVILVTDGDFNVGVTNQSDLVDLITEKAKSGVFLSVLGFGTGNVKDSTMEKLADKGNGNYAYIDSLREGKKVLVEQMGGTLITIAKDVKIQVEFNPATVSSYRLVGYENRALKKEDFNDDKKDAGEIGAGHTVTALYEVIPVSSAGGKSGVDPLKYAEPAKEEAKSESSELLTVKLRYKEPTGEVSKKLEFPLADDGKKLESASRDFQFASAVAEFGQLLRRSEYSALSSWEALISRAADAKGTDVGGYRAEFIELAKKARDLSGGSKDR